MIYKISSKQYKQFLKKKEDEWAWDTYKEVQESHCLIRYEEWTPWHEAKCLLCDTIPFFPCHECKKIWCTKCLQGCLAFPSNVKNQCDKIPINLKIKCPFCRTLHHIHPHIMGEFERHGWVEKFIHGQILEDITESDIQAMIDRELREQEDNSSAIQRAAGEALAGIQAMIVREQAFDNFLYAERSVDGSGHHDGQAFDNFLDAERSVDGSGHHDGHRRRRWWRRVLRGR